jgi:hypothetical protein
LAQNAKHCRGDHRNQTIPKRLASVRESVQQAKSESDNGNMAASEWSDMGSATDCIGRMAMRLSEREYRKLGSFGIDGYVARVAKTERARRNQRANH